MADVSQYDEIFKQAGAEWNVDPLILKAIAEQESRGNPGAVSKAGARGVMQIMPDTGAKLGATDLHDPAQSIYAAAKYMSEALDAEKTPEGALLYYHGGPGWRSAYGPESRAYVPGVTAHYVRFSQAAKPSQAPAAAPAADTTQQTATPPAATTGAPAVASDSPFARALDEGKPGSAGSPAAASASPFQAALDEGKGEAKPEDTKKTDAAPARGVPPHSQAGQNAYSAAQRIVQAGVEGYENTPGTTPEDKAKLESTLGGKYIVSPVNQIVGAGLGIMGGVGAAGQRALYEGGEAVGNALQDVGIGSGGPRLGRDVATLGGIVPMLAAAGPGGAVNPLKTPEAARVATTTREVAVPSGPPAPQFVQEFYGEGTRENPLAAAPPVERPSFVPPGTNVAPKPVEPPAFVPPNETGPNAPRPAPVAPEARPSGAAPGPAGREAVPGQPTQATGAQLTPSYEAIYTPAEETAYRQTAEGSRLLEHQAIGELDLNQYIPGVNPNQVELEQSVNAARDMKQLGIQSKEASEMAKVAAQRNNEAREVYSLNTEKTPVDIHNREMARQAHVERQSAEVFAPENVKGEVSMDPLIKQMRDEMNLPRNRENSALQAEFNDLIKRLTNEDGTARTMSPEQAWGLRQDLDRMTDKLATTGTDAQARNRRRVAGNLDRVAGTLDGEIEKMASGYKDMLATYKAHSDAIREMEVLQGLTAKLKTGPQGSFSFAAMQRFMKNVIDARSTGAMDLNAYKSISEATMQRLWNLRDDLRRSAGALELSRAAGSDTAQNILDAFKHWGKLGAQGAAHAGATYLFGPGGPVGLRMLQDVTAPARAARMERRNVRSMQRMLSPGTPLRVPPGQENPLNQP